MANAITSADSASRLDPIPLTDKPPCPRKRGTAVRVVRERTTA
jgi:hypothetical protein